MKKIFLALFIFLSITCSLISANKEKVIIYTDLGDDIDDAYALALALASPELDILGIVAGYGNTPDRALVACRFLHEAGRDDIPVVVGRKTNDTYWNQYYWAKNFKKKKPITQNAVDFIIEKLKKYPNEITLVLLSPIPDIYDLIKENPEALKLTKNIISMMGSFYMGYDNCVPSPEWNVCADLESSKVFIPFDVNKTLAGLDITINVKLLKKYRERIFLRSSPLTNSLKSLYTLQRYEKYSLADSNLFDMVAMGILIWPDLYKFRKAHIKVTDEGYTVIDESKEANCTIAMHVDKDQLLDRFTKRLLRQNLK